MRTRIERFGKLLVSGALLLAGPACSSDAKPGGAQPDGAVAGGDGSQAGASGSNGQSGQGGVNFVPMFPGAGTGNAGTPLTGGMLCDYVPRAGDKAAVPVTDCFFGPGQVAPAATIEQALECVEGKDVVHLRLTFDPAFVDNTYGLESIGWPLKGGKGKKGAATEPVSTHTFEKLVGSDHAELILSDGDGEVVLQFKLDYVSQDSTAPSGYASLGVSGGDGKVIVGDASAIVAHNSSIDRNLNERGYAQYTEDSPATDAMYTPNSAAPEWDFRVVYEAWVDVKAFGDAGFGGASIEYVHASPAKTPSDTIEVEPGPCPPCNDADGCEPPNGPPDACVPGGPDDDSCFDGGYTPPSTSDACVPSGPDDDRCFDGGAAPGPAPLDCTAHPEDPTCQVD